MSLANGRGRLGLPEKALTSGQAPVLDEAPHHAGLDLLKVVRLGLDFSLEEADVGLVSCLLLRKKGRRREKDEGRRNQ